MTKKLLLPFLMFLVLVSKGQNTVVFQNQVVSAMYFINDNIGFIGVSGGVYKTVNGGQNWTKVRGAIDLINDIKFSSSQVGYYTVWDSLYKTVDAGQTWNFVKKSNKSGLHKISCFDDNHCVVNKNDSLLKTSDGGLTWTTIKVTSGQGVSQGSSQHDGLFYFSSGKIYRGNFFSNDFGVTWGNLTYPVRNKDFFMNDSIGFILTYSAGISSLNKTINFGNSWSTIPLNFPNIKGRVVAIHGISDKYIMVACSSNVNLNVGCSVDGGTTWTFKEYPENLTAGDKIFMSSLNTAWVGGTTWGTTNSLIKMTNTVECFNTITSTSEIAQQNFNIYPNPTQDVLNIATESPVNYFITELGGKQVLSGFGQNADVSSLSNGIYFISFEHQNQRFTFKFVKQ